MGESSRQKRRRAVRLQSASRDDTEWRRVRSRIARLSRFAGTTRLIMKKLLVLGIAALTVTALSARAADGKESYEKNCAKCHGKDGKGQTVMGKKLGAKDYTDPKVQEELKDEAAIKAIKEGLQDKDGKSVMKPSDMSDADAKALVEYMRTFKK
jgi:mono/diheme cytochrome c family protein